MPLPRVDVVIAARNEAARLGSCLESLAAQDYPADRVRTIVVDSGSTDTTAEVAALHGAEVLRETRPGAGAARNRGVEAGSAEFVAFLDAHCVVNAGWLRSMVAYFDDARTGGCQARIDNRASSPRLERYLERSGAQSNPRVLEDTLGAEHTLYPWILSGNSMYRREALQAAGGFDPALVACEDVDLAWRIVLLGYQLAYSHAAVAVHWSDDSWPRHLRKASRYGSGSATLARRYVPDRSRTPFRTAAVFSTDIDAALVALSYWLGYRARAARLSLGLRRRDDRAPPAAARRRFRSSFAWRNGTPLRISEDVVYWSSAGSSSVIVHLPSRTRMGLGDAGHHIWSNLARGASREETVRGISRRYGVSETTAAADLDELVEELLDAGVLVAG